jgi:metallophosphoesterase superfamily enzyme
MAYKNCFYKWLQKLIEIIGPDIIIVAGDCWKKHFKNTYKQVFQDIKFITIYHPGYPKNKTIALNQIREGLLNFDQS